MIISGVLFSQSITRPIAGYCLNEYYIKTDSTSTEFFYILDSDTISGKIEISKVDNGVFSQYAKYYSREIYMNPILSRDTNDKNQTIYEYSRESLLFSGQLENGKKTGKWKYHVELSDLFPSSVMVCKPYYGFEYNDSCFIVSTIHRTTIFSLDSTIISGTVFQRNYHIDFLCHRESGCVYKLAQNGEIITTSNYDDFELTLFKIEAGVFNRIIIQSIEK